jgi:biotin-(acetyl-CoA carboxylase) ligase
VSLVLRSALPAACAGALVLEAARSLLKALESSGIPGVSFRWPNDIVAGPRKLGGILADSYGGLDRPEYYVLGVGLNAAHVEVPGREAAGLAELAPGTPRRRDLALGLSESLRAWCERPDTDPRRWAGLEPDPRRPARAELWNGRILGIRPRGYTARGELSRGESGPALAYGECRKITYEGEEP